MATRREFLVEKGLAKPGRGRFSAAAKQALADAEAAGEVFDDTPTGKTEVATASDDASEQPGATQKRGPSPVSPDKNSGVSVQIVGRNRRPAVRNFDSIVGETIEGFPVEFSECKLCLSRVSMCRCRIGITPPSYVATVDSALLAPIG
jgi:hypothetical protein